MQVQRDDRAHLRLDVRGDPVAGGGAVARGDGGEDGAVVGQRALGTGAAVREPDQRTRLGLELHLRARQPQRPGRRGQLDVEARVGRPALGLGHGPRQPLHVLGQPLEVGGGRPLRRERGRGAGDRGAVVGEVAQVVDAQLGEPLDQARVRGVGRRVHERAAVAPAPRLDEAGAAQPHERLAQRDGRDAELRCQLGLARQLIAVAEHPGPDRVREPALDLRHPPAPIERREHRLARAQGEMTRHPP